MVFKIRRGFRKQFLFLRSGQVDKWDIPFSLISVIPGGDSVMNILSNLPIDATTSMHSDFKNSINIVRQVL